jgi:hypothetical protein
MPTPTLEEMKEKHTQQSELAVFWSVIADHLPKNTERSALGDEAIFSAFAVAYSQIKDHLVSTAKRETLREVLDWAKPKQCSPSNDPYNNEYEHGYDRAIFEVITHLESELTPNDTI